MYNIIPQIQLAEYTQHIQYVNTCHLFPSKTEKYKNSVPILKTHIFTMGGHEKNPLMKLFIFL